VWELALLSRPGREIQLFGGLQRVGIGRCSRRFDRIGDEFWRRTARKHPANFAAYEYFLKGIQHQQRFTDSDIEIADEMFKRAVELDPQYAEAHAWWAFTDFWRWSRTLDPTCLAVALNKSKKAVELDPQSARSYLGLGHMALYSRQFDLAEASMRQGLVLNSNDFHALSNNGLLCAYTGRPADAHTFLEKASQIDPYAPLYLHDYRGMTYFSEGDFENALSALSRPNGGVDNFMYRAACTALLGRKDEAVIWLRKAEQEIPKVSLLQFAKSEPFTDPTISERLVSGLRMAGLPE
jgi:tetratricopeptide (TPR) repeat protein